MIGPHLRPHPAPDVRVDDRFGPPAFVKSSGWNGSVPLVKESPTTEIRAATFGAAGAVGLALAAVVPTASSAAHEPIAAATPARSTCRRVDRWGIEVDNGVLTYNEHGERATDLVRVPQASWINQL